MPLTALIEAGPLRSGWLVAQAFALRCAEGSLRCSVLEGQQRTRPRTPPSTFALARLGAQTALLDAASGATFQALRSSAALRWATSHPPRSGQAPHRALLEKGPTPQGR